MISIVRLHKNGETINADNRAAGGLHQISYGPIMYRIDLIGVEGRIMFCDRFMLSFPIRKRDDDLFTEVPILHDGSRYILEYRFEAQ